MTDTTSMGPRGFPSPGPNGAQYLGVQPQQQAQTETRPEPEGFDAGDVWVFPYNLAPYVKAKGHIPPPTQARIDCFQRAMSKLMLDYERSARETEEAQAQAVREGGNPAEASLPTLEEVDAALAEKAEAVGKMKDAVADLCAGHPTRKQLEELPEYVFVRFANVIGRKVGPEA